jgi:hypothetical protein
MRAAPPALKSLVHLDRALRIAVSASPAGCAAAVAAISKNPYQAERRFTLSDRPGRLLRSRARPGIIRENRWRSRHDSNMRPTV